MAFDINNFIKTNKRIFIWTAFFGLLYLVRDMFSLVFMTFILCFIFHNLIERLTARTPLPRRLWTIIVYLVFLAVFTALVSIVGPKLGFESTAFLKQVPQTLEKIQNFLINLAQQQPQLGPVIERLRDALSLERFAGVQGTTIVTIVVKVVNQVTQYSSHFLLSVLFSFLILFDFPNLKARTMALRESKLGEVYDETAHSVVQFALTIGAAFQAQAMIACLNTLLTAIGLWGLGIKQIALLSSIVFIFGLIPVLGVFLSSAPILLLAFNAGGFHLTLGALVMIIIVHIIEAYILNPRIFSAVFKINPVLTLIILYIGHSFFGVWGMILGMPVSVYIFRQVIQGQSLRKKD
ncbi:MAG: AI-2E family transporter [Thermodesulfobacteriota bacterium]